MGVRRGQRRSCLRLPNQIFLNHWYIEMLGSLICEGPISYYLDRVDLVSYVVPSNWNLEERFETRVVTIWAVEIKYWYYCPWTVTTCFWEFFIQFSLFFFQDRLYNLRLYVLLMYLVASIEDMCNPLLLIMEVWIELDHMVFPFAVEDFPYKNSGV